MCFVVIPFECRRLDRPVHPLDLLAIGELDAVIRQYGVDLVGYHRDQVAQELGHNHLSRPLMPLHTGKLGGAVDGHEQADFALAGTHFRDVDMEIPDGVAPERLLCLTSALSLQRWIKMIAQPVA